MRIVFCGTPDFAVPSLEALIASGKDVVGVFCQPTRLVGRKQERQDPPVKVCADAHGIPVFQFEDMRKEEGLAALKNLEPDLMVTAAFGQILSQANLDVPKMGTINVHGSLLPAYRGAAPIQCAVIDGEKETGVTILYTVLALDAGDMLLQKSLPIGPDETSGELFLRVADLGAQALVEAVDGLEKGNLHAVAQDDSLATKCRMLKKEDGNINWTQSAQQIHNRIRGLNPWPGAYTHVWRGEERILLKIWKSQLGSALAAANGIETAEIGGIIASDAKNGLWVHCGEGDIQLLEIQLPGKKRMLASDFLRGQDLKGGVCRAEG